LAPKKMLTLTARTFNRQFFNPFIVERS